MKRTLLLMIIGCFYLLSKAQVSSSINLFEFDSHRSPRRGSFENIKDSTGWAFYQYHVPDPNFFKTDIKVTPATNGR